jgi:uncharacterized protein YceK
VLSGSCGSCYSLMPPAAELHPGQAAGYADDDDDNYQGCLCYMQMFQCLPLYLRSKVGGSEDHLCCIASTVDLTSLHMTNTLLDDQGGARRR